jgi:hypothetical protein
MGLLFKRVGRFFYQHVEILFPSFYYKKTNFSSTGAGILCQQYKVLSQDLILSE